mmetsp:Transcript_3073/g.7225  ORF Transcript_3073/g.7225 Transcript_3073/m.7225 type:complete len:213 (+) Transcript_3073:2592-3230(+)
MTRGRESMLKSATSTRRCSENILGPSSPCCDPSPVCFTPVILRFVSPSSSVFETATSCSMKCPKLNADNLTVDEKTLSMSCSLKVSRIARSFISAISLLCKAFTSFWFLKKMFDCFFGAGALLSCLRNDSSESSPEADIRILASCDIHCRTGAQLSPKYSPSATAIVINVRIASIFLYFISLMDPSRVNLASELTKVSRAKDILLCEATLTA